MSFWAPVDGQPWDLRLMAWLPLIPVPHVAIATEFWSDYPYVRLQAKNTWIAHGGSSTKSRLDLGAKVAMISIRKKGLA